MVLPDGHIDQSCAASRTATTCPSSSARALLLLNRIRRRLPEKTLHFCSLVWARGAASRADGPPHPRGRVREHLPSMTKGPPRGRGRALALRGSADLVGN